MKTAIIIHGWPGKEEYFNLNIPTPSNSHWFPWIQKQLLLKGILAQTPEMPEPYAPNYEKWKEVFEQFKVDEQTILVGHSCGGGFLVRWLSENNIKVGKVVLVAPWINSEKDPELEIDKDFFEFNIDENLTSKTAGFKIMYSADDDKYILDTVKILNEKIKNVELQEFKDKGHFVMGSMKTEVFPELLKNLLTN